MNTEQAYINGFVKRAMEYGFNENEAFAILKQAKNDDTSDYHLFADDHKRTAKMIGRTDEEAKSWYADAYKRAKKMDKNEFAKEMRRVHYNRGYDKTEEGDARKEAMELPFKKPAPTVPKKPAVKPGQGDLNDAAASKGTYVPPPLKPVKGQEAYY